MPLNKLMVLTDFTEASTVAVEHCCQLASLNQAEIISLHVVQHQSDLEWAKTKTEKQFKGARNYDEAITFKAMASKSSLYKDINKVMDEQQVQLSFMATHGKKRHAVCHRKRCTESNIKCRDTYIGCSAGYPTTFVQAHCDADVWDSD